MTDYPALFQQGTDTNETLAGIINQLITAAKERAVASGITYDNATSGLLATEVKSAIDELVTSLALKAPLADPTFTGNPKGPNPTEPTGLANKQWVEGVIPDFSTKVGYPDFSNRESLPATANLVQHITEDCYLLLNVLQGSGVQIDITTSDGTSIFRFIDTFCSTGTNQKHITPIKAGTYIKITYRAGSLEMLKVGIHNAS